MGELLSSYLTGLSQPERDAFAAVVNRHGSTIWTITSGFRLNQADREEIFQTTFLRLLEQRERLDEPQNLGGWLARVTKNQCLKVKQHREEPSDIRRLNESEILLLLSRPGYEAGDVGDGLRQKAEREALLQAVNDLPERLNVLIRLLFGDTELGYGEVSEILEIPVGSIGPQRARALKLIRAHPAVTRLRTE